MVEFNELELRLQGAETGNGTSEAEIAEAEKSAEFQVQTIVARAALQSAIDATARAPVFYGDGDGVGRGGWPLLPQSAIITKGSVINHSPPK